MKRVKPGTHKRLDRRARSNPSSWRCAPGTLRWSGCRWRASTRPGSAWRTSCLSSSWCVCLLPGETQGGSCEEGGGTFLLEQNSPETWAECASAEETSSMQWAFKQESVFFYYYYFFLLKDNCFIKLHCFLSNLNVNQPYPFPFEPPSHLPSHPSSLGKLFLTADVYCSVAKVYPTFCQASLSFALTQSLLKLMSIESMMPSKHHILCGPLLLLPSVFPNIRVFSNELALGIRWPKYWNFSFSICPPNEYSGVISFRINWFDLLAV